MKRIRSIQSICVDHGTVGALLRSAVTRPFATSIRFPMAETMATFAVVPAVSRRSLFFLRPGLQREATRAGIQAW